MKSASSILWKKIQNFCLLKYILLIMLLQLSQFSHFCALHPVLPFPPIISPLFMSVGHTCKFFDFSISYTVLNIPLSIMYIPVMLLNPLWTFWPTQYESRDRTGGPTSLSMGTLTLPLWLHSPPEPNRWSPLLNGDLCINQPSGSFDLLHLRPVGL